MSEIGKSVAYLSCTSWKSLAILDGRYFVKFEDFRNAPLPYDVLKAWFLQELKMMLLAGDCSIEPVGRVFDGEELCGIIMPLELAISRRSPGDPISSNSHIFDFDVIPSGRDLIDPLIQLVARLHDLGIVHGDIKPDNVLYCRGDSKLRFCDFGAAAKEGGRYPMARSTSYCSAYREFLSRQVPLVKADDLYATGITIWELYTGQEAFRAGLPNSDIISPEEFIEYIVSAGFQPDLTAVDDIKTRELVASYLAAGVQGLNLPADAILQGQDCCVIADVAFSGCLAAPPHSFTKFVQCKNCASAPMENECPNICRVAQRLGHVHAPKCEICTPAGPN